MMPPSLSEIAYGPSECAPEYAGLWEGLVGCWVPQMGPTGTTLLDLSGYGNHGTLTNMDPATDWVPGPNGWALDFDGYNDVIKMPICNATQYPLSATAAVYIPDVLRSGAFVKIGYQPQYGTSGNGWGIGIGDGNWDTNGNELVMLLEWVAWVPTGVDIGTGWRMVTMTVAAGGAWAAYVDGVVRATGVTTKTPRVPTITSSIGASSDGAVYTSRNYAGEIAGAWVHNRALTASDVARLHADPLCFLRPRRRWWAVPAAAAGVYRVRRYHDRLYAPGLNPGVM